jgi:predicted O-linked N-acetylglucosamine transferase (SPINDLY family)
MTNDLMTNNPQPPQFNPKELTNLYVNQKYDDLSEKFLEIILHFEENTYFQLSPESQYFVDAFVKNFLYFFTQPDYIISDNHAVRFIQLNTTIANVIAMSNFKNSDGYLELLKNQPNNFVKLLVLYSPRSSVKIDKELFFNANPDLASLWYSHFYEMYKSALVNKNAYQNLREHLLYTHEKLTTFYNISEICFGATYIDGDKDKEIKHQVNQRIQESPFCQDAQIINNPRPKKIAVITSLWFNQHSVYRILAEFINSLKSDYDLTLVHLGGVRNNLDIEGFKGMKYVFFENGSLNIDAIKNNDFSLIFYPDIGMSTESIFLSNLRLAPIQVCGLGHSVSTFGSQIDYYISGADVENVNLAEKNYSERLILLPGFGAVHNHPIYDLRKPKKSRSEFIINCSWFAQKVNYPMLSLLKKIINNAKKPLLFRFFSGGALIRKNDFIPFQKDLESILGKDNFELVAVKPYDEYMEMMEEGDLCIESYHFGGCNIVADSLYLRKLMVTFEGNKWYNRIGSQMLRTIGFDELITRNYEDYMKVVLKLIHDDDYRLQLEERLQKVDLESTVFANESKGYFKKAIAYLIANHNKLQLEESKKPIIIN